MSGGLPRRWIALGLALALGAGLLWGQAPPPPPPDAAPPTPPPAKPVLPADSFPLPPLDSVPTPTQPPVSPPPAKPPAPPDAFPLPPLDPSPTKPVPTAPPVSPVIQPPFKPASQPTAVPANTPSPAPAKPAVTEPKPPAAAPAIIVVEVPANATIWIEDQRMTQTGPIRSFQSPPLEPGKTYIYKFRLTWPTASGQPSSTEHEITVSAGQTQRIDFRPLMGGSVGPTTYPIPPQPLRPYPGPIFPRYEGSGYQ